MRSPIHFLGFRWSGFDFLCALLARTLSSTIHTPRDLNEDISHFLSLSMATSTKETYTSAEKRFLDFCHLYRPSMGKFLPVDEIFLFNMLPSCHGQLSTPLSRATLLLSAICTSGMATSWISKSFPACSSSAEASNGHRAAPPESLCLSQLITLNYISAFLPSHTLLTMILL